MQCPMTEYRWKKYIIQHEDMVDLVGIISHLLYINHEDRVRKIKQ